MTSDQPRIRVNDYSTLPLPAVGEWAPRLSVSIVIPAYGHQDKLDLTLASLAEQTYPADLTEVIVVDDGSEPALAAPPIRPANTRFITSAPGGWGSAHAVNSGVAVATGEVILRLDADMVVCREHIEAHMRWHHTADYLVVVGTLTFAPYEPGSIEPARAREHVARSAVQQLFGDGSALQPSWVEKIYSLSDDLRTAAGRAFQVADGACISFPRRLFELAGGMDAAIPRGSDTEFGYRLSQVGAVFVPDRQARCWHLGRSEMESNKELGGRQRIPYVAARVPLLGELRQGTGIRYRVPLVEVIVETPGQSFEDVIRTTVSALNGSVTDVQITLVGPWTDSRPRRGASLTGTEQDQILLRETFQHDCRVRLVDREPEDVFPTPFALRCPAGLWIGRDTLHQLLDLIEKRRLGIVMLPVSVAGALPTARLERTAALARARSLAGPGEDIEDVVHELYGVHWVDGAEWALVASSGAPEAKQGALPAMLQSRRSLQEALAKAEERAERWKREAKLPIMVQIRRRARRRLARVLGR